MRKNVFRVIEIIISMIIGAIIVTYTQDIFISIVYIISIGIAYSLLSRFLKKRSGKMN